MSDFVWDPDKERLNIEKHRINFSTASLAFKDPKRKIFEDHKHSDVEVRHFCVGKVSGRIITVRFIYRDKKIRIFGAGYWRAGKEIYEKENL